MYNKLYGDCQIKASKDGSMTFSAYGNVKNIVDKALDMAMDGCYSKSIAEHNAHKTAPALLWSHDPKQLPVGKITAISEDSKGLPFEGKLSKTSMGKDLYELAMDDAINKFSIGYTVSKERMNHEKGYNELIEINIKEISFVNFACNDESRLQEIKSHLMDGIYPTKREMEKILRSTGFSRKQAEMIASNYTPGESKELIDVNLFKGLHLFK